MAQRSLIPPSPSLILFFKINYASAHTHIFFLENYFRSLKPFSTFSFDLSALYIYIAYLIIFKMFITFTCVLVCEHMCEHVWRDLVCRGQRATTFFFSLVEEGHITQISIWRSEDFMESFLFFHFDVGSRNPTQLIKLTLWQQAPSPTEPPCQH